MFANRRANYKVFDDEVEDGESGQHDRPPAAHDSPGVSFTGTKSVNKLRTDHRWDHIENVDQFFTLIYEYYQGNGLLCIGLRQILSLFVFIYVVCVSTFLGQCIEYDVLFNNRNTTAAGVAIVGKRQFKDAIVPHCVANFHPLVVLALFLATCFCLWQMVCIGYHLLQLREIKIFYATALEIDDSQLMNIGWNTVVTRLCDLQPRLHLIINQDKITPLDVYQRILRYKNYFVALIYNDLIPTKISMPFVGNFSFLSSGLRLNLEWLLFWGPWSPWQSSYALRNEYKDEMNLELLAEKMRRTAMWMGLANLLLFPFIFLYQIIFHFFSYADSVKREPGIFGTRKYANYGRARLRHFNELDHELQARLNRSYSFAVRYMDQFFSPVTEIVAKKVALVVGSIFAVLALLSAWDEDVLTLEHVITVMAVCGTVAVVCRSLIPNENLVYCQEFLMRQIIANIHYAPKAWLDEAHSSEVCREFSQLFQLRAQCLAEELISPIVTPFILFFSVRQRAMDFVIFFHHNTKSVNGLGDVCSYALMDISTDGDVRLAILNESMSLSNSGEPKNLKRNPAFCGKVEMSLLNFATMNPEWVPPPAYAEFINRVRECTMDMLANDTAGNAIIPNTMQEIDASVRNGNTMDSVAPVFAAGGVTPLTPLSTVGTPLPLAGGRLMMPTRHMANTLLTGGTSQISSHSHVNETSMVASLSNINPFITNHMNANYQPRNVMEDNSRALRMSYNAIVVNRMLAANQPTAGGDAGVPSQNRRLMAMAAGGSSGYGALGASAQMGTISGMGSSAFLGGASSRYGTTTTMSNLWGVPELSQPLLNEDDGDESPNVTANHESALYIP